MSTVKAINFQHPSATAVNLTLAADGSVSGGLPAGGRNIAYNGAFQVNQRSASVSGITTTAYHTADRWLTLFTNTVGTWTQSIEADAPTGSGFRNSLKMLCTTAKSVVTTDLLGIAQKFEGQDLQKIKKGTSSAQPLTLSFWVKGNVTGTYIALLYDEDNNRQVAASYTISASGTWERKTITFPADTTGAFANDNTTALWLFFHLAAGADLQSGTLQTTWATYNAANRAVGQVNVAAATSNYWQVTGVQLETGSIATDFEFKTYGQELRECQRYFFSYGAFPYVATQFTNGRIDFQVPTPVPMRVAPDVAKATALTTDNYAVAGSVTSGNFNVQVNGGTTRAIQFYVTGLIGSAGQGGHGTIMNTLYFSAEL